MSNHFRVTDDHVAEFNENGYIIVKELFNAQEMDLLLKIGKGDRALAAETRATKDAEGGESKLALRNDLPDTMYSAIVKSRRVADNIEKLIGDEVYHFHHKMMVKEPRVGGAWEWHQDYGYWYKNNHCLFPDMASCYIAVDKASKENGCLQVIRGSHKCGRIEHGVTGTQTGADVDRVNHILERLPLDYVEIEPGTACFFHSNLLHRSDQNRSENPRWSLICCYNTKHNDPFVKIEHGHPNYSPLDRLEDEEVLEIGRRQWAAMEAQVG